MDMEDVFLKISSYMGNENNGGYGIVFEYNNQKYKMARAFSNTNKRRLLLRAAIDGLQMIPSNTCIAVCSAGRESITLPDTITKNNWRPHMPDVHENSELGAEIGRLIKGRYIFWRRVHRDAVKDAKKLAREVSGSMFRYDDNDQIDPPMLEPFSCNIGPQIKQPD